jgi:GTPase
MEEKPPHEEMLIDQTSHAWFDRNRLSLLPALLIGVYQGPSSLGQTLEHLHELKLLAETRGIPVLESLPLQVRTFSASLFLGQGKIALVKEAIEKLGAKLVIFDDEISPAQQRNLEMVLRVPIIDRTEVILGVFAERAKTREAKLQIELAKVKYLAPRLKHLWTHFSKQTGGGGGGGPGGGGYLKGEGEKQLEIDKRLLKKRTERLTKEIDVVRHNRETQHHLRKRRQIPVFAIVGYTNAGKSTLMKALTGADVFIEDKLFATLDTTTRKFQIAELNEDVLMVDTVGFIRKLPHLLVMAFRSTLEDAAQADVLIHVIDASHPQSPEQAEITLEVLRELGAGGLPIITVLNKMDLVHDPGATSLQKAAYSKLKFTYSRPVEVSALNGEGVEKLVGEMAYILKGRRRKMKLRIPQHDYNIVSEAIRLGQVISKEYDENDVLLEVEFPLEQSYQFEEYII